jgi:hypothetical protein
MSSKNNNFQFFSALPNVTKDIIQEQVVNPARKLVDQLGKMGSFRDSPAVTKGQQVIIDALDNISEILLNNKQTQNTLQDNNTPESKPSQPKF